MSLTSLYFISNIFDNITLHGFDGWDKAYEYYHYFDNNERRTTEWFWSRNKNKSDHKIDSELKCITEIIEKYNLKRLVEK